MTTKQEQKSTFFQNHNQFQPNCPNYDKTKRKWGSNEPEVGAARENEAMELVGGAHGVDDDVGEGTRVEALDLDVVAERSEVAVQRAQLAAGPVVVGL